MIIATHYNTEYDFADILTDGGTKVTTHTFADVPYVSNFNAMVVTEAGIIYLAAKWVDKVARLDKNFNILVEEAAPYITQVAIDPDGYIWTSEISDVTGDAIFKKRDPLTLAILDTCDGFSAASSYAGMIFDSNGFLYVVCWGIKEIEKWNVVTKTRVGHRALANHTEDYPIMSELRIRGETVYLMQWASFDYGDYWTCPTDLSADFEPHELVEFDRPDPDPDPSAGCWAANIVPFGTTGWIVFGVIMREVHVLRYDNDFNLLWTYQIDGIAPQSYAWALDIGYYPYIGDYPLAPVMFPAKVRKSTLREKCRLFEESISDVCLVVNHNTTVTRRYLQETYGDTTHPESSNLRFILPSQQLVKLLNKDLTTEDYNAIINNFITNISSMFTLINENNTLIKTWLDDYMPDEEGHEFTNVKMRPMTIGEDLSKTMDNLFEGIIDNVTVLNMNLEVLKERF